MKLEVPSRIEKEGGSPIRIRLHDLPRGEQPPLNQVAINEGKLPDMGQVALEHNLIKHHKLNMGDTIWATVAGKTYPLTLTASVSSAEYPWVARNEIDLLPSPAVFGIGWVATEQLEEWKITEEATHELLIQVVPGTLTETNQHVVDVLGAQRAGLPVRPRRVGSSP